MNDPEQHDLVVIGCGAAGLAAAVTFLETTATPSGPRVVVLEREVRERRGGSTAWTTAYLGVTREAQLTPLFREVLTKEPDGRGDLDYVDTFEQETPTTLSWIREHGIETAKLPAPAGSPYDGPWVVKGGGRAIVDELSNRFEQLGGEIRYETTAQQLVAAADGSVEGVVTQDRAGRARTLLAGAVVIASGGFEGNPDMLAHYIGKRAATMPLVAPGPAANRGEGIRMATEIGAGTGGQFDRFHGEPVDPRSADPEALIMAYPYGILVDGNGQRFVDESVLPSNLTFEVIAEAIFRQADQHAWFVFDERARAASRPLSLLLYTSEPAVTGASLDELAAAIDLDPVALHATINAYNDAIDDSVAYDPMRLDGKATRGIVPPKSNWALPIDTGPFSAYPVTCAICFTYGGLSVDTRSRVLRVDGTPIHGLWAAGEVTGVFHAAYPPATSVLRSLTFGRIAGDQIAAPVASSS